MSKFSFIRSGLLLTAILLFPQILLADQEMPNTPYVKASDMGGAYIKSYPKDNFGEQGKLDVYKITGDGEALLCSFDWYADDIYLTDNFRMGGDSYALVRIGPWPKGREPDDETLAIAFYKGCKEIKRYSTADIVKMGYKNPKNVVQSASHYSVFKQIKGFRPMGWGQYAFDIITFEGNEMSFDTATGALRTQEDEENLKKAEMESLKPLCDQMNGVLERRIREDGSNGWTCKAADGSTANF
jgi:hypothetical protein